MLLSIFFLFLSENPENIFAQERTNSRLSSAYYDYFLDLKKSAAPETVEKFLLRAQDWLEDSSDLSFELASIRDELARPRRAVLAALDRALVTSRWIHHSEKEALLFRARLLFELKDYYGSLAALDGIPGGLEVERMLLKCLLGLRRFADFRERLGEALLAFGDDVELIRLAYQYAESLGRSGAAGIMEEDRAFIDKITERIAREGDTNAAIFDAAPYIYDTAEARRLLRANIAGQNGRIPREALAVLLNFGVIDEDSAIETLFSSEKRLPVGLLRRIFELLRTVQHRERFLNELGRFSGSIFVDINGDGVAESFAEYEAGILSRYVYDPGQERADVLSVEFMGGDAARSVFLGEKMQNVEYKRYPEVKTISIVEAGADGVYSAAAQKIVYYFAPDVFYIAPFRLEPLCAPQGLAFPEANSEYSAASERVLLALAQAMSRPSMEFQGAVEELRLSRGTVLSSVERLAGVIISRKSYRNGIPHIQYVDTDLDGRLETIRHFVQNKAGEIEIDYIEVDHTGDGVFKRE